jgi:hypothetical protein
VDISAYGATGNGVQYSDGVIASGTTSFSSKSATFTPKDAGKYLSCYGCGLGGFSLVTKIAAFVDNHHFTLAVNAGATATAAVFSYGTDDWAAIQAAIDSLGSTGGHVLWPSGRYFSTRTVFLNGLTSVGTRIKHIAGPGAILDFEPGSYPLFNGTGADRALIADWSETTSPRARPISAELSVSSLSLMAANGSSDTSDLTPGQYLNIVETDPKVMDVVCFDWAQVASVSGATVTLTTPIRDSCFLNNHSPASLNFFALFGNANAKIVEDCGIDGLTVVSNWWDGNMTHLTPGIDTHHVRNTIIQNTTVSMQAGQPYYSYRSEGTKLRNVKVKNVSPVEIHYSEIGASVDYTVDGFNCVIESVAPAPGVSCGLATDFGTGFFQFNNINLGASSSSQLQCIYGGHDGIVTNYVAGYMRPNTPANNAAINYLGCYNITIDSPRLTGGAGTGNFGIQMVSLTDAGSLQKGIASKNNLVLKPFVGTYPTQTNMTSVSDLLVARPPR